MGNYVGRMQGPVPPALSDDVAELLLPFNVPGARVSPSYPSRRHSTLTSLVGLPPRPDTSAASPPPPILLRGDLPPDIQVNVATGLDLGAVNAPQLTDSQFRDFAAPHLTLAHIPTSFDEIGRMKTFFDRSKNIHALQIQDPASFTDDKLAQLVQVLGDRGPQIKLLDLSGCRLLTNAGLTNLVSLTALQSLNLSGCYKLTFLPNLERLTALQSLNLKGCDGLTVLSNLVRLAA